ncbi:hypothetical protein E3N88_25638 [Mikania micrantha]|uniref:GAG-pre-integrase domain-containing protein n=1 Tax=Mikania micrantha TaxID=192012 RepID=A0A5N6N6V7_9ASTR|nr:hypothetical protein E3N88_25638 [Mikania micrantha]
MPTNIEQALHTMTLNPDQSWYLDTGATNHMSNTTVPPLNPPFPPLQLNNILLAPHLIKNLLSVRRLTTDNMISIEFDPFGFLVKDYQTRIPILRCNSTGDLYPLSLPAAQFTTPTTFAALSQDLWHRRLGHPGSSLLRVLNKEHSISVAKVFDKRLCQSCVFGKHTRLPFYDSLSTTSLPLISCIVIYGLPRYLARGVTVITYCFLMTLPIFYGHTHCRINQMFFKSFLTFTR